VLSERLLGAIDQLVGGREAWDNEALALGWWAVSFPEALAGGGGGRAPARAAGPEADGAAGYGEDTGEEVEGAHPARSGAAGWGGAHGAWHIDGAHWLHRADSREQGLLLVLLFSDCPGPGDGGTAVAAGSHVAVADVLLRHAQQGGEGLSGTSATRAALRHPLALSRVVPVQGCAGDVALVHPMALHARSRNLSAAPSRVRVICNPMVVLRREMRIFELAESAAEPEQLLRAATPVERPILWALIDPEAALEQALGVPPRPVRQLSDAQRLRDKRRWAKRRRRQQQQQQQADKDTTASDR
jgi:hypothetical protein